MEEEAAVDVIGTAVEWDSILPEALLFKAFVVDLVVRLLVLLLFKPEPMVMVVIAGDEYEFCVELCNGLLFILFNNKLVEMFVFVLELCAVWRFEEAALSGKLADEAGVECVASLGDVDDVDAEFKAVWAASIALRLVLIVFDWRFRSIEALVM